MQDPQETFGNNEKLGNHVVYGEFYYNKWYPLRANDEHMTGYSLLVDETSNYYIKNVYGKIRQLEDRTISLSTTDGVKKMYIYHVVLNSVFHHIQSNETVDHIDQNHNNNNIMNLQWLSRTENSSKNIQKCDIVPFSIVIPHDEVWKVFETVEVSNYGRIKRKTGIITIGSQVRDKKYRYVSIADKTGEYRKYYVHILVYTLFHGTPKHNVLHNDSAPLHPDGTYRNWAIDLTDGSQSQNMKDYHENKRKLLTYGGEDIEEMNEGIAMLVQHRPRFSDIAKTIDLPKCVYVSKSPVRCVFEMKLPNETIVYRGSKSDKLSLAAKVEEIKAYIKWLLEKRPEVSEFYKGSDLKLSPTISTLSEEEQTFINNLNFDLGKSGKKSLVSKLPDTCAIKAHMIPKYAYYVPASTTRGDKFVYKPPDGHGFSTTSNKNISTEIKFNELISKIQS